MVDEKEICVTAVPRQNSLLSFDPDVMDYAIEYVIGYDRWNLKLSLLIQI